MRIKMQQRHKKVMAIVAVNLALLLVGLIATTVRTHSRTTPAVTMADDSNAVSTAASSTPCSKLVSMPLFNDGKACASPLASPCFEHTRCASQPRPTMYVYDQDCSLTDSRSLLSRGTADGAVDDDLLLHRRLDRYWRAAARDAGVLAETYDSACVFVHVNQRTDRQPCASEAPLWNRGANHVMVDLTGYSRDHRPAVARSLAMEAAITTRSCYYRAGYDVSLPTSPKDVLPALSATAPWEREYFLTMQGAVDASGGQGPGEESMAVISLHDPSEGIVVTMHCLEDHEDKLSPESIDYCLELEGRYREFSSEKLMSTTFGLVPAGESFRLGEVMSAGAIPVFIATNLVRPFREEYDWPSFSFVFAPSEVGTEMLRTLRSVPKEELQDMQRESLEAYQEIYNGTTRGYTTIANRFVRVLERRIMYH